MPIQNCEQKLLEAINIKEDKARVESFKIAMSEILRERENCQAAKTTPPSIDVRTPRGKTALMLAVERNDIECVSLLIAAKADVNARNFILEPVIITAIQKGHIECLELLTKAGADLVTSNALTKVAEKGDAAAMKVLIDAKANPNIVTYNSTPLTIAQKYKHSECVDLLINAKADPLAVIKVQKVRTQKYFNELLEEKADLGKALIDASNNSNIDLMKMLIEAKADPNVRLRARRNRDSALLLAVTPDCVKILLDAKANPNIEDLNGMTKLEKVAREGNVASAQILLDAKADINKKSFYGSPLMAAVCGQQADAVELLIDAKADIHATTWGHHLKPPRRDTALTMAHETQNREIIGILEDANSKAKVLKEAEAKMALPRQSLFSKLFKNSHLTEKDTVETNLISAPKPL